MKMVSKVERPLVVCGRSAELARLVRGLPLSRARYWPTPWCLEGRLQSALGSLLRSHLLPAERFRRQVLRLDDGGQAALDWLEEAGEGAEGGPVVLLVPGLCGGAGADYARCVAGGARALGARLVVFSQRGRGGLPLTSPRLYCALSHGDLAQAARAVRERWPDAPLLAVGVSLGGLILGHYLATEGERALFAAALIVSSPLDVIRGSECIERGWLNALLSRHMAAQLRSTLAQHAAALGAEAAAAAAGARSVRQFDAAFTARHFGFGSADEYYRAASLHDKLHLVRVPTLCLQAADDPFQPLHVLPLSGLREAGAVCAVVPPRGGHIGFLEGCWPLRRSLLRRAVRQYFGALLRQPALLHRAA